MSEGERGKRVNEGKKRQKNGVHLYILGVFM